MLVDGAGQAQGVLPPVPVVTPWWQDIRPVVQAVRAAHRCEATVLRLLSAERPAPPGGQVTYLAEIAGPAPAAATPWAEGLSGALDDHPLRLPYARPGGPAADLAWAAARLTAQGLRPRGRPQQERTWNLSSLWRIKHEAGAAWLKVVPPFFAHEGALIEHLAGQGVAPLIARDGPRLLLAEVPGTDLYQSDTATQAQMIRMLVGLQARHLGQTDALLGLGLNDWRPPALEARVLAVAERQAPALDLADRRRLAAFTGALTRRVAALDACGPGDTLVHGDFHPGNFRGGAGELTLLDWGDACVGHPLLDHSAFLERAGDRAGAMAVWRAAWREEAPGADFDRASRLIAPLAAARRAVIYQDFLDGIEPSEHPYHAADPPAWLRRTLDLADSHGL